MKVREKHILGYFMKGSHEIQFLQDTLDSFQNFQDPLDTLHLEDKLLS